MILKIWITVFALIVLIQIQIIEYLANKKRKVNRRLKVIFTQRNKGIDKNFVKLKTKQLKINRFLTKNSLKRIKQFETLDGNLIKAGIPLRAEELLIIIVLSGLLTALIGTIVFSNILPGLLTGLIGFFLPIVWVNITKTRRNVKLEAQLLDAVVMLSNSLRAGHSFMQGLELVSKEISKPLSEEFLKIIKEIKVGTHLEDALTNAIKRVDSKDFEMLLTGVLIQRQVGGNLAEILDSIALTIEKRIKMRSKIRTLTAQGRASAWVVSLLPFGLAAFIFTKYLDFAKIMTEETIGKLMLAGGVTLLVIGILIIQRIVNIDV